MFATILRTKGYANVCVDYVLVDGIQKMGTFRLTLPVSAGLPPSSVLIHTEDGPTYTVRIDGLNPAQAATPESAFRPPPKPATPGTYAAAVRAPKAAAAPPRGTAPAASQPVAARTPKAAAAPPPAAAEVAAAAAAARAAALAALVLAEEEPGAAADTVDEADARRELADKARGERAQELAGLEDGLADLRSQCQKLRHKAMALKKGSPKRRVLLADANAFAAEKVAPAEEAVASAADRLKRAEQRVVETVTALQLAAEAEAAAAGDPPESEDEGPPSAPPEADPPDPITAESPAPAAFPAPETGPGDSATPVLAADAGPEGPAAPQSGPRHTPSVTRPNNRPRPMDEGEDRRPVPDDPQIEKKPRPEEGGDTNNAAQA